MQVVISSIGQHNQWIRKHKPLERTSNRFYEITESRSDSSTRPRKRYVNLARESIEETRAERRSWPIRILAIPSLVLFWRVSCSIEVRSNINRGLASDRITRNKLTQCLWKHIWDTQDLEFNLIKELHGKIQVWTNQGIVELLERGWKEMVEFRNAGSCE